MRTITNNRGGTPAKYQIKKDGKSHPFYVKCPCSVHRYRHAMPKNAKCDNETRLRTSAVHTTYLSSKITENFFPFVEE